MLNQSAVVPATASGVLARVSGLVPVLRSRASEAEKLCHMHPSNLRDLTDGARRNGCLLADRQRPRRDHLYRLGDSYDGGTAAALPVGQSAAGTRDRCDVHGETSTFSKPMSNAGCFNARSCIGEGMAWSGRNACTQFREPSFRGEWGVAESGRFRSSALLP